MRVVVPSISIRFDGEAIESETTVGAFGPHVLVLSTSLPTLGVTVTTTYVGADDTETVAVDLVLGPSPLAAVEARAVSRHDVAVTCGRERCLLDHLACVQASLELRDGISPQLDAGDQAIAFLAAM